MSRCSVSRWQGHLCLEISKQLGLLLAEPWMPLLWASEKRLVFKWISQDVSSLILHLEILTECVSLRCLGFWYPNRIKWCYRSAQRGFDVSPMCQMYMLALNTVHPKACQTWSHSFVQHISGSTTMDGSTVRCLQRHLQKDHISIYWVVAFQKDQKSYMFSDSFLWLFTMTD